MAFGIQVFLCSGRELRIYSQVQPAVLCFAGSMLCNWETQRGLLIFWLWQPEISHLCLLASATRSPAGESKLQCCEATCSPSVVPLKLVWHPSVERRCWKCPSSFPSYASFCCLWGKDHPLQPNFSLLCLPASAPLCQTCRGQGAVKILHRRGREDQAQMNFLVHTSARAALALQLLTKAPCNDPSFILSLALGERTDLSSLKKFTAQYQGQEHDFRSVKTVRPRARQYRANQTSTRQHRVVIARKQEPGSDLKGCIK